MMRTVGREGSDVLSSTRSLWQWKCQSPPTSHNLRANTLLVISKVRGHMITICTELSCRNPHPCHPCAAVLALGMAQEQGWGRACVSGASSRVPWGPRLCLETELPRMALVGKLSPCGQVPCVSWLLALGAGKDGGTALGHCWPGLAALRCSSAEAAVPCGAVSVPKGERCVGSTRMAARARAVLSWLWSFCCLQPASSPGWACTPLPACFRFFPALKLRC